MNTRLVNSAAGVINAALAQCRTAAGIALALESAGLLMTPETAAELKQLRARVAELEAVTPAAIQTCRVCGAGYSYGNPCSTCLFRAEMAAELQARGLEDPHDSPLHHSYKTPRDLPELGGQR